MLNISEQVKEAINSDHEFCHLIKIEFASGPVLLTDAVFDVEFNGETYLGNGVLLGLDAIKTKSEINIGEIKVAFTLVEQSLLATLLGTTQVNRLVTIHRAYLNGAQVIPDAITLWSGLITGFNGKDGKSPSAAIRVASEWADYKKAVGRRSTTASQQRFFPDDLGFEFAPVSGKEYKWGSE